MFLFLVKIFFLGFGCFFWSIGVFRVFSLGVFGSGIGSVFVDLEGRVIGVTGRGLSNEREVYRDLGRRL